MILRTVNLQLVVGSVAETQREVERLVTEHGGFIAGSQVRQDGDRFTATITLRVPADGPTYGATMARLRALAEQVLDEQIQSQDVTEEYVDLDARLRTLQATEDRLFTFFQRAETVTDVLAVQRELTEVRGKIEQAQGRRQALERRAAMTTITLALRETPVSRLSSEWSPAVVAGEAWRTLVVTLRGAATLAIWWAVWLPLYGPALLALWWLRRWMRANARRTAR